MFEIYALGDANYLIQVLNGITMATSGSDYVTLISLGFMISVFVIIIRALIMPRFEAHHLLVAFVIYAIMFIPRVTVVVEDANTGVVRVSDNAPLGIAAIGSTISSVGYGLSRLIEQAFTLPGMTETGYMTDLQRLLHIRNPVLGRANNFQGNADVKKTLTFYVKDCTLSAVNLGLLSEQTILESANTLEAIRFNSEIWGTKTFLAADPVEGSERSCREAHSLISAQLTAGGQFYIAWREALKPIFGDQPYDNLQLSLNNLVGPVENAYQFMRNSLVSEVVQITSRSGVATDADQLAAIMLSAAKEQQNIDMAAQESMFIRYVKPLIVFLEALTFGIAPLMGFLFTLGPWGMSLVGKYFMMAAWIQLWAPVMSLTHLYTSMAFSGKMASFRNDANLNLSSMLGQGHFFAQTEEWIAIGGMLTASTPVITLALIFGGAISMSTLARRIGIADKVSEQVGAPDHINAAPHAAMVSRFTGHDAAGLRATGTENMTPRWSISQIAAQSVSSAHDGRVAAQTAFDNSLARTFDSGWYKEVSASHSTGTTASTSGAVSKRDSVAQDWGRRLTEGAGLDSEQRNAFEHALGAMGGAGLSIAGNGARLFGQMKDSLNLSDSQRRTIEKNLDNSLRNGQDFSADYREAQTYDERQGIDSRYGNSVKESDMTQLRENVQRVEAAERKYTEASELRKMAQTAEELSPMGVGQMIRLNPGLYDNVMSHTTPLDNRGIQDRIWDWQDRGHFLDANVSRIRSGHLTDDDKAVVAAAAMDYKQRSDPTEWAEMMRALGYSVDVRAYAKAAENSDIGTDPAAHEQRLHEIKVSTGTREIQEEVALQADEIEANLTNGKIDASTMYEAGKAYNGEEQKLREAALNAKTQEKLVKEHEHQQAGPVANNHVEKAKSKFDTVENTILDVAETSPAKHFSSGVREMLRGVPPNFEEHTLPQEVKDAQREAEDKARRIETQQARTNHQAQIEKMDPSLRRLHQQLHDLPD